MSEIGYYAISYVQFCIARYNMVTMPKSYRAVVLSSERGSMKICIQFYKITIFSFKIYSTLKHV